MKEIKKIYSFGSMFMVTIMMIVCTLYMIYQKWLPLYIFCVVLNCIGIKCWYDFFCNVIIKPKEEILYLIEKNGNRYFFINNKGKRFGVTRTKEYELNKFYLVLKTKDYIIKIIKCSDDKFVIPEVKDSYWAIWYSPNGSFPGLLPIVYLIFIIALSWHFSLNSINFNIIIMVFLSGYLIIYDLIYKLKKQQNKDGIVDDSKLINSYRVFWNIVEIIKISIIFIILFILFIIIKGIGKLFLLPFLLCSLSVFGKVISKMLNNIKLMNFFDILYRIIFWIYWFSIISLGILFCIVNKEYEMIPIAVIFELVGIWGIHKDLVKKK